LILVAAYHHMQDFDKLQKIIPEICQTRGEQPSDVFQLHQMIETNAFDANFCKPLQDAVRKYVEKQSDLFPILLINRV
jgi:hypothetical protein